MSGANTVINIDTLNRVEVDVIPIVQRVASRSLVRFGGTADACNCIISLRNSQTKCWSSDVLDLSDSQSVLFVNNRASNLAPLFFGCRISCGSSASVQFLVLWLNDQLEMNLSR